MRIALSKQKDGSNMEPIEVSNDTMISDSPEYRALPLPEDRKCEVRTQFGHCTNVASWQICHVNGLWQAMCYVHMHIACHRYREQREEEKEELRQIYIAQRKTDKLD
jgi:hypothetical protein